MDHKKFIRNKSICTLPWSGFELLPNGNVKNCVVSTHKLGNIHKNSIHDILHGGANIKLKESMLKDEMPANCSGCYLQESDRNKLSSISSRLYYHRELGTKIPMGFYDNPKNFSLKHVDLRWTNACNQACVYCTPQLSSKWAQELGEKVQSKIDARQEVKDYVFDKIAQLENVYLAGGEPMLMKENLEFLRLLKEKNPQCAIRINTNLSTTETGVFELLCSFENVHWIVSVETIEEEYEYIRHHGKWRDFCDNLEIIKKLGQKISFNMLHFVLNYKSIHRCVDYFKANGYHENSFIIGPLTDPAYFSILNLPEPMVKHLLSSLKDKLRQGPKGYLKNSYENLLSYYRSTEWNKDIKSFYHNINVMDKRRGLDSRKVFKELYKELYAHSLE